MDRPERCAHRELVYDYIKFLIVRKNLDMNEVRRLYLDANLAASQIGEMFGVSKQMILSRLRRIGVRRTPDPGRTPDNYRYPEPPYGLRKHAGRLVPFDKELKTVRLIVEAHERRKLGWGEIVRELNDRGILTRRGRPWNRVGIKRVWKRWHGKI